MRYPQAHDIVQHHSTHPATTHIINIPPLPAPRNNSTPSTNSPIAGRVSSTHSPSSIPILHQTEITTRSRRFRIRSRRFQPVGAPTRIPCEGQTSLSTRAVYTEHAVSSG